MNDDDEHSSNGSGQRSWIQKLSRVFSNQPRDLSALRQTLQDSSDQGILPPEVLTMMEGALSVSEMQVRDAMVPRSQMVVVPLENSLEEVLPQVLDSGHSRFPVIREDKDEVEGILLAKDLLHYFTNGDDSFDLKKVIRPAVMIPESKRLNILLRDFRVSRNHMAIVIDEYGGVAGLITIEDVLEEIVGDIDDEHDVEEDAQINRFADDRFMVQALTPIEDFNEVFQCQLSEEEFDTVGGLVMAEFGRLPREGESVKIDQFQFEVITADDRRLHLLELRLDQ